MDEKNILLGVTPSDLTPLAVAADLLEERGDQHGAEALRWLFSSSRFPLDETVRRELGANVIQRGGFSWWLDGEVPLGWGPVSLPRCVMRWLSVESDNRPYDRPTYIGTRCFDDPASAYLFVAGRWAGLSADDREKAWGWARG